MLTIAERNRMLAVMKAKLNANREMQTRRMLANLPVAPRHRVTFPATRKQTLDERLAALHRAALAKKRMEREQQQERAARLLMLRFPSVPRGRGRRVV